MVVTKSPAGERVPPAVRVSLQLKGSADSVGGAGCRRRWVAPGGRVAQVRHTQDRGPFVLGQTTPDAVGLKGVQCPLGAPVDDRASLADGLGPADTAGLDLAALAGRVVEDFDVHAPAGAMQLPVVGLTDRCGGLLVGVHGSPPSPNCPRSTCAPQSD